MYNFTYFCGSKISDFSSEKLFGLMRPFEDITVKFPITGVTELNGVLLDFNSGLRLQIPEGNWHVKISDYDSKIEFFDQDISETILVSAEKFFVRWEIILYLDDEIVFYHLFDPKGQKIHFQFMPTGMGDHIVLFPYMEKFRLEHECQVSCTVPNYLQELVKLYYPYIECVEMPSDETYAIYYMAPSFSPLLFSEQCITIPMEQYGREILNLNFAEKIIYKPTKSRQIQEPYVCIAVQASSTIKSWLNPQGWDSVVEYLKNIGYRVLCIDKNQKECNRGYTLKMPQQAEDFTGDIPLSERINLLAYADFFIGCSSGLAWLAWACDIPVILISGITAPWFEFSTPYRIYNRLVCHGCLNWTNISWGDYERCPTYGGTERAYECSKKISAQQVINAIDDIRTRTSNSNPTFS